MMTSTSFNLLSSEKMYGASRTSGRLIIKQIFALLEKYEIVEIDVKDALLTPSIADEVLGELAQTLGKSSFKQRIKIKNASPTDIALLRHVIARRLYGTPQ